MKNEPPGSDEFAKRVNDTYFAALDIESDAERETFIQTACEGDDAVRREVDALFNLQEHATTLFQEHKPSEISAADIAETITSIPEFFDSAAEALPDDDEVGKTIGNYQLIRKIGEGGVGNVYLAEQLQPVRRQVAFKIIKAGMDTKSVIARFEAERQALALMEHPNIARVLNAGETETGRPYFVMDLVHGQKITAYCDEHSLTLRQRLELVRDVCHAIQHAHQKGIIHRDIKPSNVLVAAHDGVPRPVVIDFGIAKATTDDRLTDKTINTGIGPIIGTPAYMSPEQTNLTQPDIDTRSDIYALGVLLYELLTGKTPFEQRDLLNAGLDNLCRILREQEPPSPAVRLQQLPASDQAETARKRQTDPRRLAADLSGDLGWIVLMAMDKERDRRYETANAMAMDIEHVLNSEPVMAHPPARLYRFRKLVRRNKAAFAYLTVVCAVVLAGLGLSTWLFLRERDARLSERRARQSEQKLLVEADARERIAQAALLLSRGRRDEANRMMEQIEVPVIKPSLEAAGVFRSLAEWNAAQGRWSEAADHFLKLQQANRMDKSNTTVEMTTDLLGAGPALVAAGRLDDYHRFVQETLDRFSGTSDASAAEQVIKNSLILPQNESTLQRLAPFVEIVEQAVAANEPTAHLDSYYIGWRTLALSLYEIRRGNAGEAVAWSGRSLNYPNRNPPRVAMNHLVLAIAHARQGHLDEARRELAEGHERVRDRLPEGTERIENHGSVETGVWHDWVIAYLLLQEAETILTE